MINIKSWVRFIVVAAMMSFLSACGSSKERIALREALVRTDVALGQGVSFDGFSTLLLDMSTKYALAKDGLSSEAVAAADKALFDLEAVHEIWRRKLDGRCERECVNSTRDALLRLGIVHNNAEYASLMRKAGIDVSRGEIDPTLWGFIADPLVKRDFQLRTCE